MLHSVYICLGVLVVLMSLGRIVWRHDSSNSDWALVVAFIRLDFPPDQRSVAQKIAAGLAEIVGMKIKQLRPEHTLRQIAQWSDEQVRIGDLSKIFYLAFDIVCDENTTFRALVETVTENQARRPLAAQDHR